MQSSVALLACSAHHKRSSAVLLGLCLLSNITDKRLRLLFDCVLPQPTSEDIGYQLLRTMAVHNSYYLGHPWLQLQQVG
jgi:hypothetical protein